MAIWDFGSLLCGGFHSLSRSPLCLPLCEWRRAADLREQHRPAADLRSSDLPDHPALHRADHAADGAANRDDGL